MPATQPLPSYLAKHLSGKALIGINDNDTRCVSLRQKTDRGDAMVTHVASQLLTHPFPPTHQSLVNPGNWEQRHKLECVHPTNTQVTLHKLQNRIYVLCVQFSDILCHMTVT